ncbi:MAG: hypothetical protein A2Z29_08145 [Chloroflexi bacterium RBG_16_56_11]|nr:MAG: hypothetical protein A2Z29_08145 [Chloroflexi bacterium RBG_16_56_11]
MKKAVQMDFDGTVTIEDVSYLLLDEYASDRWRHYLEKYTASRMSVGAFSRIVFGMITSDEKTLTDFVRRSDHIKIKPGLKDFLDYCKNKGVRVVIVSHGLMFYINTILAGLGISGVEVHAAENDFHPGGMKVRYIGPDGAEMDTGFKEAYTVWLKNMGYDVIYIGDGASDIYSCRKAAHIFATGTLLELCRTEKLFCAPFSDFFDVIRGLEPLLIS